MVLRRQAAYVVVLPPLGRREHVISFQVPSSDFAPFISGFDHAATGTSELKCARFLAADDLRVSRVSVLTARVIGHPPRDRGRSDRGSQAGHAGREGQALTTSPAEETQ